MSSLIVLDGAAWQQITGILSALQQCVGQERVTQMVQELQRVADQAVCQNPVLVLVRTEHLEWSQIVKDEEAARLVLQRVAAIEEMLISLRPEAAPNSSLPPWTALASDLEEAEDTQVFVGSVSTDSAQLGACVSECGTFFLPAEIPRTAVRERVQRVIELTDEMVRESEQAPPPIGIIVETNHGDHCAIVACQQWVAGDGWEVMVSSQNRENEPAYAIRDLTRWVVRFPPS